MKSKDTRQLNFFSEMSERQISAREFFSNTLIRSLERNFDLKNMLISYFDTHGKFLSTVNRHGVQVNSEKHPYCKFFAKDLVRQLIHEDAVRDQLTYFNVVPRLYKSTDVIPVEDYEESEYVKFIRTHFGAKYSVTMAFGINAYIQVTFFKEEESGDFTDSEIEELERIYVYIANSYKNFKKHEQAKIVSGIQSQVIEQGAKAYLVTDDFMHIMSCNKEAQGYLKKIIGPIVIEQLKSTQPCNWLPFLLGNVEGAMTENSVQTRVIQDYIFKINTHDQSYSNGIIDRYYWITIAKKEDKKALEVSMPNLPLTQAERRVAELMYKGLTYKAIADELVVSYHTVKKHVQNIYTKCGVKSRFQLYQWIENKDSTQ